MRRSCIAILFSRDVEQPILANAACFPILGNLYFFWGRTPVLRPTSTSACSCSDMADSVGEERVLEDPRRPGGPPHSGPAATSPTKSSTRPAGCPLPEAYPQRRAPTESPLSLSAGYCSYPPLQARRPVRRTCPRTRPRFHHAWRFILPPRIGVTRKPVLRSVVPARKGATQIRGLPGSHRSMLYNGRSRCLTTYPPAWMSQESP